MTPHRPVAFAVIASALIASIARGAQPLPESKGVGFGLGPLVPATTLSGTNDLGIFGTVRGFYFPDESRHGVRAALWAGGTRGKTGIQNGFGWGAEMDYAHRFGRGAGPFQIFVGAGFGGSKFTVRKGTSPGATLVKVTGTSGYANAGIGYAWKRVFLEASYVWNFDDQAAFGFVPVVVGVTF